MKNNQETGLIPEIILMKLATVELVLKSLSDYAAEAEHLGCGNDFNPPVSEWAISAAFRDLADISGTISKAYQLDL